MVIEEEALGRFDLAPFDCLLCLRLERLAWGSAVRRAYGRHQGEMQLLLCHGGKRLAKV